MKSYTNIEQSKKLVEILPIKSADGFYEAQLNPITNEWEYILFTGNKWASEEVVIPCWSLIALLDVIPSGQVNFIRLPLNGENRYSIQVLCGEEWKFGDWKSDPIDACYEMILKLKENFTEAKQK